MLTERIIRDAQSGPKAVILWDRQVRGLGLRIAAGGTKSFILNFRIGGRERRATLARAGEISLKDARRMAAAQLVKIRAGEDPLERQREEREAPTVGEGMARFFGEVVPERIRLGKMRERTAAEYRYQWDHYLAPKLARRKVADVTRQHVERAISGAPPTTRNRLLALVSRTFNQFELWGIRPPHTNPTKGVERAREEPRDRVLSPAELAALSKALAEAEAKRPAAVAAIRVLAVTGLRVSEVAAMRWEDVDLGTGRLVLPTTKTGRRVHGLTDDALAILAGLPRINEWVFTVGREAPVTYRYVRTTFQLAAAEAGIENARPHDLRRGYMTVAAAAGASAYVVRDLLGHRSTRAADAYVRAASNPIRETRELVSSQIGAAMGEVG